MELSRTINSDKRYYLDKKTIENTRIASRDDACI